MPATEPDDAWWREGVLYQIYPRSFQDSDGDGIGDLRGIIERLDHLNGRADSLGIDGIWISPFYPSPMADFGYDVADYCDVDPRFGTLADFDELLREAHARGIRVVVDLVPNHTSDEHAWFRESRSSRTNPKRDWYVWADPKPDGSPPNNWQTAFSQLRTTAWTFDEATGQYYLHSYLPEQPDLNWWNPAVRDAFDEVMRFWLDRGVDGFRVDVAHRMARDPELRDNPAYDVPFGELLRAWSDDQAPRDQDWPGVHDIIRRFRRTVDAYPGRLLVGEVYLLDPVRLLQYYGNGSDEFHLAFNFAFLRAPWSAEAFREEVATFERLLPPGGWPDYTLSNHDNPRAVSRYAPDGDVARGRRRARMAAVMLLTLRGTPFIYQGEEIGMADGEVPPERVVDVSGRDGSRTPMQWDGGRRNGGFTTGEPWLPVGGETAAVNVASQLGEPRSMLEFYRRLIRLRRSSPALRRGSYRPVESAPPEVFAWWREADGERWLIACNFGASPARLVFDSTADARSITGARLRVSSDPDRPVGETVPPVLEVGPEEGLVVEMAGRSDGREKCYATVTRSRQMPSNLQALEVSLGSQVRDSKRGGPLAVTEERLLDTLISHPGADHGDLRSTAARPLRPAMIAAWPLDVDEEFDGRHSGDPWVAIVRESILDYRSGRADRARQRWSDDIRWRLAADGGLGGEWVGPEQVFNLHRLLRRETEDTFRQRLIALEGARGPFVDAHLRTTAHRAGRSLDVSTLVVFEVSNGRISCVTELPGDRDAWRRFWAD